MVTKLSPHQLPLKGCTAPRAGFGRLDSPPDLPRRQKAELEICRQAGGPLLIQAVSPVHISVCWPPEKGIEARPRSLLAPTNEALVGYDPQFLKPWNALVEG